MKPMLKWAGGKAQLLKYVREMLPSGYNRYFEPFLGGGAVLLDLTPREATVNDINPELVNMYAQVKVDVDAVVAALKALDGRHARAEDAGAFYYAMRALFNEQLGSGTPEQAARLIYLNKHCFNGLFRVNARGLFNVPFNKRRRGDSFCEANMRETARYLRDVVILNGDFEDAVRAAEKGDFVFLDSPYVPVNPASFTDYTKEGFEYADHVRLADVFRRLSARGVFCMLTNHNTELVRSLYGDFHMRVVQAARNINARASARKGEEVIITNYVCTDRKAAVMMA